MSNKTANLLPPRDDSLRESIADGADASGAAHAKLADAMAPGYQAEFDPSEADAAGAFTEDALSEADAAASTDDAVLFQPAIAQLA